MAVQLASCVVIQRSIDNYDPDQPDVTFTARELAEPLWVERAPGGGPHEISLDMIAIICLYNGVPGRTYTLTVALGFPEARPDSPLINRRLTWPDVWVSKYTLPIRHSFEHLRSGTYPLRFLVDGSPVGEVGIVVFWEDERGREIPLI